jgi:Gas vesicle protein
MSEPSLSRTSRSPGVGSGIGSGALGRQPDSLADVLERVLDKGIVIAGDIVVNVLDIELLTLKLRLFVSSAETAKEMGLDWWSNDPFYSGRENGRRSLERGDDRAELEALRDRIAELEAQLQRRELGNGAPQVRSDEQGPS